MEGIDEDNMRALMQLQYNANKLHIDFHQKVVALRSKYEANLESIYQAHNQHTNNRNFNNYYANNNNNDDINSSTTLTSSNSTHYNQRSKIAVNTSNNSAGSGVPNLTLDTTMGKKEPSLMPDSEYEIKNKNASNAAASPPPRNQMKVFRPESEMSATNGGSKDVPAFWYRCFANSCTMLREIQIVDQPILYCLKNVKVKTDMTNLQNQKNYSFRLEFHFNTNDYFTNSVLTKEYFVQLQPAGSNKKMDYTGPQVTRSRGCKIYWKPGMNVTEIEVRSLKNDKNKKNKKVVVKHYTKESFFNFFTTPEYSENEALTDKQREELENDYALGLHIKEKIVPKAISYFLGEMSDSSSSESSVSTVSSGSETSIL